MSPLAAEWALAALDTVPAAELPQEAAALRRRVEQTRDRTASR
jgi:hypothetical protein